MSRATILREPEAEADEVDWIPLRVEEGIDCLCPCASSKIRVSDQRFLGAIENRMRKSVA